MGDFDVGWETWLASFHGAYVFTHGYAALNFLKAVVYAAFDGALQAEDFEYLPFDVAAAARREHHEHFLVVRRGRRS